MARLARGFDVLADGAVGRRSLGDADQDPLACRGLEPGADFLLAIVVKLEVHDDLAALRGGLELDERRAVLFDVYVGSRCPVTSN